MPLFHFNVEDGHSLPDLDGTELPDLESAKVEAVCMAGAMPRTTARSFGPGALSGGWTLQTPLVTPSSLSGLSEPSTARR